MSAQPEDTIWQDGEAATKPCITISERFHFSDADLTFRSNDGVLYAIHRKNLDVQTGGFPPVEFQSDDEVVPLTENSDTLDLLFQSIYPQHLPDFDSLPFEVIAKLAEAAEKYQVFWLMRTCKARMKSFLPSYALDILSYAAKHGYPDIVGEVAPLMLDKPFSEVSLALPSNYFVTWVNYIEHWRDVQKAACRPDRSCLCGCGYSNTTAFALVVDRLANLSSLQNLEQTFSQDGFYICGCMKHFLTRWKQDILEEIKKVPKYPPV